MDVNHGTSPQTHVSIDSPALKHRVEYVGEVGLHVVEAGNPNRRPVVLLHGIGMDWRVWQSVARRLTPYFHVFMVDLRGHGKSSKPESGYGLEDYASDIERLVEELGLRRSILVGSSLGGLIAAVVESPSKVVSQRVLVDPPLNTTTLGMTSVRDGRPSLSSSNSKGWSDSPRFLGNGPPPTRLRAVFSDILRIKQSTLSDAQKSTSIMEALRSENPKVGKLGLKYMAETWLSAADGVLLAALKGWGTGIRQALEEVAVPTLIMRGNPALGGVVSADSAAEALSLLPLGEIRYFENAGHAIHAMQPQTFVEALLDFSASLPSTKLHHV